MRPQLLVEDCVGASRPSLLDVPRWCGGCALHAFPRLLSCPLASFSGVPSMEGIPPKCTAYLTAAARESPPRHRALGFCTMADRICKECGSKVPKHYVVCEICGEPFEEAQPAASTSNAEAVVGSRPDSHPGYEIRTQHAAVAEPAVRACSLLHGVCLLCALFSLLLVLFLFCSRSPHSCALLISGFFSQNSFCRAAGSLRR